MSAAPVSAAGGERGPLRLALATPAGRFGLWAASVVAALRAAGLVLVADGAARGVVAAIEGGSVRDAMMLGLVGALCQSVAAWAGQAAGARSSVGAKTALRRALTDRVFAGSGRDLPGSDGALTLVATRSLDEIDDYFTAVVPAFTACAVVPLMVGARILLADWVSALIIVLTLPLVPVFMILIGQHTADRIARATAALDRLSGHLVELARGVPVLVGLGRLPAQTSALRDVSRGYRDTTMTTLRTAFLSALALELIATLSVAVVAVFVGVRLVHGTMGLEEGLLALILAPECYLPLRRLGAAFHSTENGLAAHDRVRTLIDTPVSPRPSPAEADREDSAAEVGMSRTPMAPVRVQALTVHYERRARPVLDTITFSQGQVGLLAVTGDSGAGKSTLLGALAGLVRAENGTRITGRVTVPGAVAIASQRPVFAASTVAGEVAMRLPTRLRERADDESEAVRECLRFACLDVDPGAACEALSPGQQRRLALARVRASVMAGSGLVLLDEPTAHLDRVVAAQVRTSIAGLAADVPVIAATHDAQLAHLADRRADLRGGRLTVDRAGAEETTEAGLQRDAGETAGAHGRGVAEESSPARDAYALPGGRAEGTAAPVTPIGEVLRRLIRAVNPFSPRFLLAVLCGAASVAAGAALTAVSAWLIVRASAQPPIMFLLVAIVGVRFFGLARAVLAYIERLLLHDAVLTSLTRLRVRLWMRLAHRGVADRRVSREEGALRTLVAAVDDVRDLVPRVVMPPLVALAVSTAAVWFLFAVHPIAGWTALLAVLVAVGPASAAALFADRRASAARLRARDTVLGRFAALLGAREDLLPDGAWQEPAAALARADGEAAGHERRALVARGAGEAIATGAMIAASAAMVVLLAPEVVAGALTAEMLAVAVLLPLGLTDVYLDSLAAVQQWPALRSVLADLDDDGAPSAEELAAVLHEPQRAGGHDGRERRADGADDTSPRGPTRIRTLAVDDLELAWPGAGEPVLSGLTARFPVPGRTVVTGASGAGKTTLVSALMRFLDPVRGTVSVNGRDTAALGPQDLAGLIAWCPQEAHVFDSTLRGNLLIARGRDDAPDDAEMEAALRRAGLGALFEEAGLDVRVGASGAKISGGQRQRLAVARTLLVGADVVILDEPTAHLDEPTAREVMTDLDSALADTGVVLVTHDESLVREGDTRIRL